MAIVRKLMASVGWMAIAFLPIGTIDSVRRRPSSRQQAMLPHTQIFRDLFAQYHSLTSGANYAALGSPSSAMPPQARSGSTNR